MTEPNPDTWQDALNRRLRTFIRTAPIHQLTRARRTDSRFEHQDLRALALRALDITIERMGLGYGVTHEELREELCALIRASALGSIEDAAYIADVVIEGLLNESERRVAFSERYVFLDGDEVRWRKLPFHLLRELPAPDGTAVLEASTEAINLYAGMLEYPVEDAQTAELAVLRSQLRRGRIDEAVRTAKRARVRSIEFEQKVLGLIQRVRRDVQQVDWVREVLRLLEEARSHLEEHMQREREALRSVRMRLEKLEVDDSLQLVALKDTLDDCYGRHLKLHARLISANNEYLEEHNRQAFRRRSVDPLPDPEADLLRPLLSFPIGQLAEHADWLLTRLQAPRPPAVVFLPSLVEMLLSPRREVEDQAELEEADLEEFGEPAQHFTDEDHKLVNELLSEFLDTAADKASTLSELLRFARSRGVGRPAVDLLVLHVLRAFDSGQGKQALRVSSLAPRLIDDEGFFGDELELRRIG